MFSSVTTQREVEGDREKNEQTIRQSADDDYEHNDHFIRDGSVILVTSVDDTVDAVAVNFSSSVTTDG